MNIHVELARNTVVQLFKGLSSWIIDCRNSSENSCPQKVNNNCSKYTSPYKTPEKPSSRFSSVKEFKSTGGDDIQQRKDVKDEAQLLVRIE